MKYMDTRILMVLSLLILPFLSFASLATNSSEKTNYSPYVDQNYPNNLYWGDTHIHTTLSPDAYSLGTTLSQKDAYRFAKGETVISNTGQPVAIGRPLDFVLLSDHAEFLGVFPLLDLEDPLFVDTELGHRWLAMYKGGKKYDVFKEFVKSLWGHLELDYPESVKKTIWEQITATADKYNEPGKFTAFIGFEWSSLPNGNNLHRNIIFRDDASMANQVRPFSALDSSDPEQLWRYLSNYEEISGGKVLAISHNGNVSNGQMFSNITRSGDPLTGSYAISRMRWEPLYEATQIKGDGEAHPYLSPDDDFSDYETWDKSNLSTWKPPKQKWMLKYEYARSALKLGLEFDHQLGTNPFKFGMIGSSDSHTGLAAVEENNFWGKFGRDEPSASRSSASMEGTILTKDYVASGYAGVWARENTRESLFDAMLRKETYATTGPRMMVRFFGGWAFDDQDHKRPDYAAIGYKRGVPMGGDLSRGPKGKSPRFMIMASKDSQGANLDRIQVVKGWLNIEGLSEEKVYNVAVSDHRLIHKNSVRALPSSVDIETATYTNTVGAVQLSTVWQDPDFDPRQRAFYYVRVLEILTPRWTTYDAIFYGTKLAESVPAEQQERAYTSPIWYTP